MRMKRACLLWSEREWFPGTDLERAFFRGSREPLEGVADEKGEGDAQGQVALGEFEAEHGDAAGWAVAELLACEQDCLVQSA